MGALSRVDLKKYFEKYDTPTASQFAILIDSVFNVVDDKVASGFAYSAQTSYPAGSVSVFGGKIYVSLTTTSGAFDPDAWDEIKVDTSQLYASSVKLNNTGFETVQDAIKAITEGLPRVELVITEPSLVRDGTNIQNFQVIWVGDGIGDKTTIEVTGIRASNGQTLFYQKEVPFATGGVTDITLPEPVQYGAQIVVTSSRGDFHDFSTAGLPKGHMVYCGVHETEELDASQMLSLKSQELRFDRLHEKIVNCVPYGYVWLAYPKELGRADLSVNGLTTTFLEYEKTLVDDRGKAIPMYIYRTAYKQKSPNFRLTVR